MGGGYLFGYPKKNIVPCIHVVLLHKHSSCRECFSCWAFRNFSMRSLEMLNFPIAAYSCLLLFIPLADTERCYMPRNGRKWWHRCLHPGASSRPLIPLTVSECLGPVIREVSELSLWHLKGTLARDFLHSFFFIKSKLLVPWSGP